MITFLLSIGYLRFEDSLGVPYYRLFNVIWLPFLKIQKFRVPSLKIRKFRVISVSCFLIEMKFKFKLGCCLIMENVSFSIPHLRKKYFQIYTQQTQENPTNNRTQIETKQNKTLVPRTYRFRKFSTFLMSQIDKNNIFKDDSIFFLYFLKHFGDD